MWPMWPINEPRVKHTFLVSGTTMLCRTQNIILSVGPERDPHREVVVLRLSYVPPRPVKEIRESEMRLRLGAPQRK